ncbi:MAG TPA: tRNA dihydrouridine synthase DusB [Firmicutes bacterium]|nr:tRNA dihydrouridine synthase DusB [Bacillota bacterium]
MMIGDVSIKGPLVLAPMAGVTDSAFRRIAKEMGADLVYTEMISDKALVFGNKKTVEMIRLRPEERPVSCQIFGSDPEFMARAAKLAEDAGADLIDINMGCPTPKIVRNGEGAALMRNPGLAGRIVGAVASATTRPVTVKIRKGWDSNSVNAVEIARVAVSEGAKAIAVHGRTRDQLYSGRADWGIIARVKEAVAVPVIGNGDVRSPEDVKRMLDETGCDAVMIGRGALGNPWIFLQARKFLEDGSLIPPPTLEERLGVMLRHFDMAIQDKGERIAVLQMRKHLAWYLHGLRDSARVREAINSLDEPDSIRAVITNYFASLRPS